MRRVMVGGHRDAPGVMGGDDGWGVACGARDICDVSDLTP